MIKIACIALGGALGALSRYGMGELVTKVTGSEFPWGTLLVNLLGCLLFGLLAGLAEQRIPLSEETRLFLMVGFLGAFTTFSTFAFHSGLFAHEGQWGWAIANILLSNVLGIALLLGGLLLGRSFS